jgi:hypothetical protein
MHVVDCSDSVNLEESGALSRPGVKKTSSSQFGTSTIGDDRGKLGYNGAIATGPLGLLIAKWIWRLLIPT